MDLLDWNSLIDSRTKLSKLLLVPNIKVCVCVCFSQALPTKQLCSGDAAGVMQLIPVLGCEVALLRPCMASGVPH